MTDEDAKATREFEIRNILTQHCGTTLTFDTVNRICCEINDAMSNGPCRWAFGPLKDPNFTTNAKIPNQDA